MNVRIVTAPKGARPDALRAFLDRPAFDPQAEQTAREALDEIRKCGDEAVARLVKRFDGVTLRPEEFLVDRAVLTGARQAISAESRAAVQEAHERIVRFARAGLRKDWSIPSPRGGMLGERFVPFSRVGVYVPGGQAPLASTALMTVTLAKVAGVPEIVACTPAREGNDPHPVLLHALQYAGATEVYRVGGIQAIGMMAYGTRTVRRVEKIVGPGGAYVTAAKRLVYGDVALDLVAGPSEIAVLADDTADPAFAAADLLSQIEHGTGFEKALLVTSSARLARAVAEAVASQAEDLSRRDRLGKAIEENVLLVVVRTLNDGMDVCNEFAPEHLEIMVREPQKWLPKVRNAGAVFVGAWTPESAGDFVAGPSHVLPTGGSAARFAGLTADDFRRRMSFVSFTRADLSDTLPTIEEFGRIEGLDGHARAARIRFEKR